MESRTHYTKASDAMILFGLVGTPILMLRHPRNVGTTTICTQTGPPLIVGFVRFTKMCVFWKMVRKFWFNNSSPPPNKKKKSRTVCENDSVSMPCCMVSHSVWSPHAHSLDENEYIKTELDHIVPNPTLRARRMDNYTSTK